MMRIAMLLGSCIALINARCPNPMELPRKHSSTTFLCARLYQEKHRVENLSCGGKYRNIYNGENIPALRTIRWDEVASSLVVKDGCVLDVFVHDYYGGSRERFTGKVTDLHWWDNKISSLSCSCYFSNQALTCTPSEEKELLAECQNPSPGSATCSHSVKNGLEIGYSVTRGQSISHNIQLSLGAIFKQIFSVGLASSTTTEYSWSTTDSYTFSTVSTTSITCDVPSGRTSRIRQVVGKCGDTVVYTSFYICE